MSVVPVTKSVSSKKIIGKPSIALFFAAYDSPEVQPFCILALLTSQGNSRELRPFFILKTSIALKARYPFRIPQR